MGTQAAPMTTGLPSRPSQRAMATPVVGEPNPVPAEQVRREWVELQLEALVALEQTVAVEHPAAAQVHWSQALNLITAGAVGCGFWGTLVGLLFLNPLLGAAVGAGLGAASWALLISASTPRWRKTSVTPCLPEVPPDR
jgi:hypothetical protein